MMEEAVFMRWRRQYSCDGGGSIHVMEEAVFMLVIVCYLYVYLSAVARSLMLMAGT